MGRKVPKAATSEPSLMSRSMKYAPKRVSTCERMRTTPSNMAVKDTVGRDVPNIPVPLRFSHAATGTLKGLALPFCFSMGLGRTPAGTMVTDGVTDFYSCGNRIYIREEEK